MPDIPAFCDNCGAIFRSGIFLSGGTANLVGNKAGPCPICGSMGTIPDGVFTATGNVLRLLSGPANTVERLVRLSEVINAAREQRKEPNQIVEEIKKEAPELSSIVDALPRTRSELYNFLLVILTALGLLIAAISSNDDDGAVDEVRIGKMVEESVARAIDSSLHSR